MFEPICTNTFVLRSASGTSGAISKPLRIWEKK